MKVVHHNFFNDDGGFRGSAALGRHRQIDAIVQAGNDFRQSRRDQSTTINSPSQRGSAQDECHPRWRCRCSAQVRWSVRELRGAKRSLFAYLFKNQIPFSILPNRMMSATDGNLSSIPSTATGAAAPGSLTTMRPTIPANSCGMQK